MGRKGKLTLYVDLEVVREAKALGLNVSKVCENALKMAIEQLRPLYGKSKGENCSKDEMWCGRRDLNPEYQRLEISPANFPFFCF